MSCRVQVRSTLDDVMQVDHWSNPSTFFKFFSDPNSLCRRQSAAQTKILCVRWKSKKLFSLTEVNDADVKEDKTTEDEATSTFVKGEKKVADEDKTSTQKKGAKKKERKTRPTSSRGRDNPLSSKHSVTD